jgi:hypothetical protein
MAAPQEPLIDMASGFQLLESGVRGGFPFRAPEGSPRPIQHIIGLSRQFKIGGLFVAESETLKASLLEKQDFPAGFVGRQLPIAN